MSASIGRAWKAELLRLTLFPSPSSQMSPNTWWTEVTGERPAKIQMEPRTDSYRAVGPFGEGQLEVRSQPLRVDWYYRKDVEISINDQIIELPDDHTLGVFHSAVDKFANAIAKWFQVEGRPAAQRLAFGGVLIQSVTSREEGYRALQDYLRGLQIDAEGMSDLLYQVNRPRLSQAVSGLLINRLSKWSVVNRQVEIAQGTSIRPITHLIGSEVHVELDINTAAEYGDEITGEDVANVWDELLTLGKEIAAKGDIP